MESRCEAVFEKELSKLIRMNPAAGEYRFRQVTRNIPRSSVNVYSEDNLTLRMQRKSDEDHYGLEKVKDRILEHLQY